MLFPHKCWSMLLAKYKFSPFASCFKSKSALWWLSESARHSQRTGNLNYLFSPWPLLNTGSTPHGRGLNGTEKQKLLPIKTSDEE